ncbi:hypothetical protein [Brevibacterium antiquum]|uniref:Uncharacterized protein n=1 Tax=Brevibacterium antiquum TaxID=234835 RepID=A0A2H1IBV3_9MICO|nr:hypothetical protein [Brevibacterium antiquum]SMX72719.1 hypothetical protein BANT10_00813 [Brevibacterium antiquum]
MASFALIPAAPILVADVDLAESARISELRASIESQLAAHANWALPMRELPPLAGLGGLGIDRGIDTRTGELLEGQEWVEAVAALDVLGRAACESAHPATGVALLHAHATGVQVGPLGSSEHLLIPVDLSVAASEDAPLAPVPGAAEVDEQLVQAITAGDAPAVAATIAVSDDAHADLELLDAAVTHMMAQGISEYSFTTTFDEAVHDVRSLCGAGTY